jgi:NAD-dependent SIR2 family protein deacetylase
MASRVFILGAGASIPAGLPAMSELLTNALWMPYVYNQLTSNPTVIADCDSVVEFLHTRYSYSLKPQQDGIYLGGTSLQIFCASHNAEELLREIGGLSDSNYRHKVATAFTRLIYRALQPLDAAGSKNCYPKFAARIRKYFPHNQITIISFNYDTLLERALLDVGGSPNLASFFSYLVPFAEVRHWNSYSKNYSGNLLLLKLHGSFNWSACQSCGGITLCWFQWIDNIAKSSCRNCGGKYLPSLVAPDASKLVQGYPWERIWEQAAQALVSCDELVMIGYSVRDNQARELLKTSLESNHALERITLVDPNANSLVADLSGLLQSQAIKALFTLESFEKYVEVDS